jgi:hypothetical protein
MRESAILAQLAISFDEIRAKCSFVHIRSASQLFVIMSVVTGIPLLAVTCSQLA